jgi:hypothetical protein
LVFVTDTKFVLCELGTEVLYISESHLWLKCPETWSWTEELLNSKWPPTNEEMALTVKNATEHRNLGSLKHSIKFKWENQAKIAAVRLGACARMRLYVGLKGYK